MFNETTESDIVSKRLTTRIVSEEDVVSTSWSIKCQGLCYARRVPLHVFYISVIRTKDRAMQDVIISSGYLLHCFDEDFRESDIRPRLEVNISSFRILLLGKSSVLQGTLASAPGSSKLGVKSETDGLLCFTSNSHRSRAYATLNGPAF